MAIKILIIGSHKATVWMSISSVQPGKGNFWTRDWRTARDASAVPAPLHIEKAVLHAYSQESFYRGSGPSGHDVLNDGVWIEENK